MILRKVNCYCQRLKHFVEWMEQSAEEGTTFPTVPCWHSFLQSPCLSNTVLKFKWRYVIFFKATCETGTCHIVNFLIGSFLKVSPYFISCILILNVHASVPCSNKLVPGELINIELLVWSSRRPKCFLPVIKTLCFLQKFGKITPFPDNHLVAFSMYLTKQMACVSVWCVCTR